jgi:sec-independent protein translocase protein TatA
MGLSFWQILLVVVLMLLLFGRGKIPALMSDIAAGIKGFKKEMDSGEGADSAPDGKLLSGSGSTPVADEKVARDSTTVNRS